MIKHFMIAMTTALCKKKKKKINILAQNAHTHTKTLDKNKITSADQYSQKIWQNKVLQGSSLQTKQYKDFVCENHHPENGE